ncbi:MAG: putative transcriptional regulator [Enterobacterales bacterium]|jgi:putative transcriptional regulator
MNDFPSLKNHFLIAMPTLLDPNFYQSVTYIIEHDEEGAMGMVINHPLEVNFDTLFTQLDIPLMNPKSNSKSADFIGLKKVMSGGPVEIERGFIIHSPKGEWEATMTLSDEIAVTTSQDILTAISNNEGPTDLEVILGYAGWEAGQLDQEILDNSWLSVKATPEILFHTPHDKRWKAAAKLIGIDISQLSSATGHS